MEHTQCWLFNSGLVDLRSNVGSLIYERKSDVRTLHLMPITYTF